MYGEAAEGTDICPGEDACQIFESARGKTREAKARNACHNCKMLPTKTAGGKRQTELLASLATDGLYLRRRRLAGYPVGFDDMTPLQFEAMMLCCDLIEHEEISRREMLRLALLNGAGLQMGPG